MEKKDTHLALIITIVFILLLIILFYRWPASDALYIWPDETEQQDEQDSGTENESTERPFTLMTDWKYGVEFMLSDNRDECFDFYEITSDTGDHFIYGGDRSLKSYLISAGSRYSGFALMHVYEIYTLKEYEKMRNDSPERQMVFELNNNLVLTRQIIQNRIPADRPTGCLIRVQKI